MIAIMLNPFIKPATESTLGAPFVFFALLLIWLLACCYAMDYFGTSTFRRFDDKSRQRRAWGALIITAAPLIFLWFLYVKHIILHLK